MSISPKYTQEELTLRELILAVKDYSRFFLRKWFWIVLGGFIGGALFLLNVYLTPANYQASLTFLLNDEKENDFGTAAVLGSLGLGGNKEGGIGPKLLELAKSRQVMGNIIFDSVLIGGKHQLLADHLIEIYDFDVTWAESVTMRGFRFGEAAPLPEDHTGNRAFKALFGLIINEQAPLVVTSQSEISGIFTIVGKTLNSELSKILVEHLYEELSNYFIRTSVEPQQATLALLQHRADSVRLELVNTEAQLARFQDQSSGFMLKKESLRSQQLNREALILSTIYAEVIKNRETAAFLLAKSKPAFVLVDRPLMPLFSSDRSYIKAVIIGGVLGGVIICMILFFIKLFQDIMDVKP